MGRGNGFMARVRTEAGPIACWASAGLVVFVSAVIVVTLFVKGVGVLNIEFFTTDPIPSYDEALSGGILAPAAGSLLLAVLSLSVVVLPALGAAIYLAEYMDEMRRTTKSVRLGLEVLAGVPDAVFGIWGLALFSMPIFIGLSSAADIDPSAAFGRSFIIGAIVMAVMVLSFVIKIMEESIRSVPDSLRQGAAALGLTKWRTIRKVILPTAAPGLITAMILGLGQIIGSTAIVWLAVGGSMNMSGAEQWWLPQYWWDTITGTGSTLTTFVYFSSPAGEGNAPNKAYGAALVLILIILGLNMLVAMIGKTRKITTE